MRIGVPPPNINKVVLLRDLLVSLVYLALYLVVLCNRCFQFTSIIEPSSLTRINLVFHRLQVWVFVSVNYATLGLATCLARLDSRHRNIQNLAATLPLFLYGRLGTHKDQKFSRNILAFLYSSFALFFLHSLQFVHVVAVIHVSKQLSSSKDGCQT